MALVAGTRLVKFQASAATYSSADLRQPKTELPDKLGRASAIYLNKISMIVTDIHHNYFLLFWVLKRKHFTETFRETLL